MNDFLKWLETKTVLPPEGIVAETKIDDGKFARNHTKLFLRKNLWFVENGDMYVYYRPTHWRYLK